MPPSRPHIPAYFTKFVPNGQQVITFIRRHPIGLVYIYLAIIAAVAALVAIAAVTGQEFLSGVTKQDLSILTIVAILFMTLIAFILILVTNVYMHNSLLITDKETIQILQRGVFQVKVSHLSHADIEDITAEQNGLLQTLFNYGTLHIETSGELKNFAFTYCPDPDGYARVVLEARQRFTESTGD